MVDRGRELGWGAPEDRFASKKNEVVPGADLRKPSGDDRPDPPFCPVSLHRAADGPACGHADPEVIRFNGQGN